MVAPACFEFAGSTNPLASASLMPQIGTAVLMTLRAMSLPGMNCPRTFSSQYIHDNINLLQVVRIYTCAISTKMIDGKLRIQ